MTNRPDTVAQLEQDKVFVGNAVRIPAVALPSPHLHSG